jgi:Zn-dependent protease with chaperone function
MMTTAGKRSESVRNDQSGNSNDEADADNAPEELSQDLLYGLLHPKEPARAVLVWVAAGITGLALAAFLIGAASFPELMLILFVYVVIAIGTIWLVKQLAYALFRGNAVQVGPAQFPDIHDRIVEAENRLGLTQGVASFVVRNGDLNAFFYRVSGRKFLIIHSTMVEDMTPEELDFIILRFLGYLRARQVDLGWIAQTVDVLNAVPILGLLTRSYDRAAVLSGDRIGAYACESTDTARSALAKFAVGAKLEPQFSLTAYLNQAQEFRQSPWNFLSRLWRTHPHLTDRISELDVWINEYTAKLADLS